MNRKPMKSAGLITLLLLFLIFAIPNLINSRERLAFSDQHRYEVAKKQLDNIRNDTAEVVLSSFYNRGPVVKYLFGTHYRSTWSQKISLPVFHMNEVKGGLKLDEIGGGQQTFSIKLKSDAGKKYTLRSVHKDQSRALPRILQFSCFRPLFRDQASALNPFAAVITNHFERALDILHTKPKMYYVPYDKSTPQDLNEKLAGRVMILEEEPGGTWKNSEVFDYASDIMSTEDLFKEQLQKGVVIDSLNYLKCRLLDIMISDWDRHGGQWEWAIMQSDNGTVAKPIAMDRDMAFFKFDDGLLNQFALFLNNKFQSFKPDYEDVSGLMKNSSSIDRFILGNISEDTFVEMAQHVQSVITDSLIDKAFREYPQGIYQELAPEHTTTLKIRRSKLPEIARKFHKLINNS